MLKFFGRLHFLLTAAVCGIAISQQSCATKQHPQPAAAAAASATTWDVHPVYNTPSLSPAQYWNPPDGWNPHFDHRKPFTELTPLFHVYTAPTSAELDLHYKGGAEAPIEPGQHCLRFRPFRKGAIAGLTYKHKGIPNTVGPKHGTSEFEEYILDFSTYQDGGKFHFRYWLAPGKRYKIMPKVDAVEVVGTGRWETVVISPLGKELFTHHNVLWIENLDDDGAEIFIDQAFFFKGEPPAGSQVTMVLKPGN